MIGKLLSKEEVNAALVLALSGAVTVLVTKGDGPPSIGRVVCGVLSNPVPGREVTGARGAGGDGVRFNPSAQRAPPGTPFTQPRGRGLLRRRGKKKEGRGVSGPPRRCRWLSLRPGR